MTEMKKMMMANVTGSGAWAADEGCKAEPTPLRNEASLPFRFVPSSIVK